MSSVCSSEASDLTTAALGISRRPDSDDFLNQALSRLNLGAASSSSGPTVALLSPVSGK